MSATKKQQEQDQQEKLTFSDLAEYMLTLGELHNMMEESNAPGKYALQIKICEEIDAILDALSIRK